MGRIFLASSSPQADLMSQLRDPSTGAWARVFARGNESAEFYRKAGIEHVPTRAAAIVDTGLISSHPDVGPLIDTQVDFTGRGTEDENGHGNLVALALLAQFPTQFAPRLINVKVAYADGRSGERELVRGLQWLADFVGSDHGYSYVLVNISLGHERRRLFRRPGCDGTCDVCRAARKIARAGVNITAAAGNRGVTLCPATAGLLGAARIAAVGALDLPTSAKGNVSLHSEVILAPTSDLRDLAIAGNNGELELLANKRAGFFGDAILAGDELAKEGHHDAAMILLETAQSVAVDNAERAAAAVLLGPLYLRAGVRERARVTFASAAEADALHVADLGALNLGLMAYFDGEYSESVQWLRRVCDSSDNKVKYTARRFLGGAFKELSSFDEAVDALSDALKCSMPSDDRRAILYDLSHVLLTLERFDEAYPLLEELRREGNSEEAAIAAYDMGVVCIRRGNVANAEPLLLEAMNSEESIAADARNALRRLQNTGQVPGSVGGTNPDEPT